MSHIQPKQQNLELTRGEFPAIDLEANYGNRYRVGRDECGDQMIGHGLGHFYAHSATELACFIEGNRKFNMTRDQFPEIRVTQRGDEEIIFVFAPALLSKLATALKAARKRRVSEAERKRLAEIGRAYRFKAS